jgi:Putative peptidoglycan binding domain
MDQRPLVAHAQARIQTETGKGRWFSGSWVDLQAAGGGLLPIFAGSKLAEHPDGANADWSLNSASWALQFSIDPNYRQAFAKDETDWLHSLSLRCALPQRPDMAISAQARRCVVEGYQARAAQYRARLKGDALAESNLKPEQRAELQQALATLGYFSADIDGEFGPITRNAISAYVAASGVPESDFLSPQLQQKLLRDAQTSVANRGLDQPSPAQRPEEVSEK